MTVNTDNNSIYILIITLLTHNNSIILIITVKTIETVETIRIHEKKTVEDTGSPPRRGLSCHTDAELHSSLK